MTIKSSVTVTKGALQRRIARIILNTKHAFLKKSRPESRMELDYGQFYSVDFHNHISGGWRDIEALERDFKALKSYEVLA